MDSGHAPRSASRKRRRPQRAPADDRGWVESTDGRIAHGRAAQDLAAGRVQHFDHRAFLATFADGGGSPDVELGWTVTDEFARRFEKLRGRSRRAVAAALAQFVTDLVAGPAAEPRFHETLHVRDVRLGVELVGVRSLSWSAEGRATFTLAPGGVTLLAIGPHGSPNRKGVRNR